MAIDRQIAQSVTNRWTLKYSPKVAPVPHPRSQRRQARRGNDPQFRDQGRLAGIALGHPDRTEPPQPRPPQWARRRERADPAVQAELADQDQPVQSGRREPAGRGQNGQSDTKIDIRVMTRSPTRPG
jgi:hypothetical protein